MKNPRKIIKGIGSRAGTLILLFQRSPFVQMLFPEARIAGLTGAGEAAKWTIATVAGLGAYDSVSGASQISQVFPNANSLTATTAVGATFSFIYQVTGTVGNAGSWSIDFPIPPGLTHSNTANSATDSLNGVPTEEGEYPIRVTAWKGAFLNEDSISQDFTIIVGPAIITQHPLSQSISSGSTATLTVGVSAGTGTTFQWYRGTNPTSPNAISGATSASYTTPALTINSTYMVRVIRSGITSFSNPATVTISANNTFADWRNSVFNSTQLANPLISGPDADPDGDGFSNTKEYIFGTAPLTRESSPLSLNVGSTTSSLSFTARTATGAGYAGRTRHYALEKVSDLAGGTWTSPAGFADITGAGQTVNHSENKNAEPTFYRLRVWLTP